VKANLNVSVHEFRDVLERVAHAQKNVRVPGQGVANCGSGVEGVWELLSGLQLRKVTISLTSPLQIYLLDVFAYNIWPEHLFACALAMAKILLNSLPSATLSQDVSLPFNGNMSPSIPVKHAVPDLSSPARMLEPETSMTVKRRSHPPQVA
jgi:hypothetical protein